MGLPKAGELVQLDLRRSSQVHTSKEGIKLLQVRPLVLDTCLLVRRADSV